MKVSLTTTDKIIFGIVAILAAVVLALILFGCNGVGVTDADGGVDAGSDAGDTDTDAPDAGTDTPDASVDSGHDAAPSYPCPFACTMTADYCLEINGQIVPGDCPAFVGAVCCHLEYWPDAGV